MRETDRQTESLREEIEQEERERVWITGYWSAVSVQYYVNRDLNATPVH